MAPPACFAYLDVVVLQVTSKAADDERRGWAIDDSVARLRVWGHDEVLALPAPSGGSWVVGAAPDCDLRLVSPHGRVSRHHARLDREGAAWILRDLQSTNGIRQDGDLRLAIQLAPGIEIEIGDVVLIAESPRLAQLRALLQRIVGWGAERQAEVDRALRAVREMATLRAGLALCGAGDLTRVARRIHEVALGAHRPFFVCSHDSVAALARVGAGTLCVVGDELPADFAHAMREISEQRAAARVIVCCASREEGTAAAASLGRSSLIELPAVGARIDDLERLILAFAADAVAVLEARDTGFREHEMKWLAKAGVETLGQIDELTLRVVALRNWGVTGGAARLGISHVALTRWARRRSIPT